METVRVVLLRGLPGTGKSTFAENLSGFVVTSSDDYYMTRDGRYLFNPLEYPQAHAYCLRKTRDNVRAGRNVIVANTFSQRWEMQPYFDMVKELREELHVNIMLTVLDLFDAGLTDEQLAHWNTHRVPEERIAQMRTRWEHDWKNGSPIPPPR